MTTAKLGVTTRMNANLGFRRGVSHAAHKISANSDLQISWLPFVSIWARLSYGERMWHTRSSD